MTWLLVHMIGGRDDIRHGACRLVFVGKPSQQLEDAGRLWVAQIGSKQQPSQQTRSRAVRDMGLRVKAMV